MLFVILMGGPGAGKGTQARLLKKALGLPQIASGDLFREHFANDTDLGRLARQYIDRGDLVPDEVTVAMIKERIARPDVARGAILDGFPRTMAQAEDLDILLDNMGQKIAIVAYIHVDSTILLKRLAGRWTCRARGHVFHEVFGPPKTPGICDMDGSELYQRDDDTEKTQRRRIEVYFKQTAPLLDYYHDKGLVVEVDGERTIGEIQVDLINVIRSVA
ncbi:MAG TPA: adenylate kinase [candidate division Zixibacteria bacterium]|nr:adenylate kinase [candidate division Zixibacteria bacterium]